MQPHIIYPWSSLKTERGIVGLENVGFVVSFMTSKHIELHHRANTRAGSTLRCDERKHHHLPTGRHSHIFVLTLYGRNEQISSFFPYERLMIKDIFP